MAATFDDQSFMGVKASYGALLLGTYTGTGVLGVNQEITLDGTVGTVGSQVDFATTGLIGILPASGTATYEGYSQIGGQVAYYFSAGLNLGLAKTTFVVTAGSTPLLNLITPIIDEVAPPFLLDTSAPAAPIFAPLAGATNDTTPTLTGTAEPGSTVTISNGAAVLGTAAVDVNGAFSFTPTTPLAPGAYSLTATATDAAGNVSLPTAVVALVVNTTGPGSPVLAPLAGATNDTTPTLAGTAEPGSTVTISSGAAVLGTAAVDVNGAFSFTPSTPLTPGAYSLTATATDAAGNASLPTAVVALVVDTTGPGSPVLAPLAGATNDTTPTLTGTAEPGSTVTIGSGAAVLGTAAVDVNGAFSFTPSTPLAPGAYSLTATATDAAGNVSFPTAVVALVVGVNDAPTGSVEITGTAAEGYVLTANNTLADADGLGAIHYQWYADGRLIAGAINSTFTVLLEQIGTAITVAASYTDLQGTNESIASTATALVVPSYRVTASGLDTYVAAVAYQGPAPGLTHEYVGTGDAEAVLGTSANDRIALGIGNDSANGGTGNDTLYGEGGNDYLTDIIGDNIFDGGDGDDIVVAGGTSSLAFGRAGNDRLYGGDGVDQLYGNEGDDVIASGAGADILLGGDGADLIFGEGGNDTIYGEAGNDLIYGGVGDDVIAGGLDADTLVGEDGADLIFGEDGNDTIYGQAGTDHLRAGAGTDVMDGGAGEDILVGEDGDDLAFGGTENDVLYGEAGNDHLRGDDGDDVIAGGDGDDIEVGGTGNDLVYGDAGADKLYGEAGNDHLRGELGNDILYGGDGSDILVGGAGNDTIYGDAGNDLIFAEQGDDLLFGGAGSDTFVFGLANGRDVLVDFGQSTGNDDILKVNGLFADFRGVLAASQQVGSSVVITVDASSSIELANVALDTLNVSDFLFV